jgi:hypothetical protein
MKTIAGGMLLALVLLAAGGGAWTQARFTRQIADAQQRLALLQYDRADALDNTTATTWNQRWWQLGALADKVQEHRATVTYWLTRYEALTPLIDVTGPQAVKDPAVLFAAANAAFRVSTRDTVDRKEVVARLDGVMQAYADLLRIDPAHLDAAYNYEYVARVRDALAKGRPVPRAAKNPTDAISVDLPPGPTLHGHPGAPPVGVDMGEFKTLNPMKFDEREEMAEPGRGSIQRRRG